MAVVEEKDITKCCNVVINKLDREQPYVVVKPGLDGNETRLVKYWDISGSKQVKEFVDKIMKISLVDLVCEFKKTVKCETKIKTLFKLSFKGESFNKEEALSIPTSLTGINHEELAELISKWTMWKQDWELSQNQV